MTRQERFLALLSLLALVGATVLSVLAVKPPACVPATAPAEAVSGARAMALLQRIAVAPHPVGTPEHDRVQGLLVQELTALGYAPELVAGVYRAQLTNLATPIAGTQSTGTVLCMAHYDSVPTGPGAGDDGSGTVTWIEVLRALKARGWQPRNDVLFLLTDGEEYGMLGAHMFARSDPRAAQVRTVINLEAIGGGGPAYLFELGENNAERVRDYATVVDRPAGSSLAEAVYHLLPNNTDLSVFLKRGVQGFNFALACSSATYHAPHDTPQNLDPGSLQHLADSALALLLRLGDADLTAAPHGDGETTFFDVLGWFLVAYPRAWDLWLAITAFVVAVVLFYRGRRSVAWLFGDLGAHVLRAGVAGGLVVAAWWGLDLVVADRLPEPNWVPGNTTSAALLLVAAVWLTFAISMPGRSCEPSVAERRANAGLVVWGGFAMAAHFWLPGGAFAFSWPVLLLALGAGPGKHAVGGMVLRTGTFVMSLLVAVPILHLLTQLAGRAPLPAAILAGGVSASLAQLVQPQLRCMACGGRWLRVAVWLVGAIALVGSVLVARWLGWRCGSLIP
jgi:hypothetical protein